MYIQKEKLEGNKVVIQSKVQKKSNAYQGLVCRNERPKQFVNRDLVDSATKCTSHLNEKNIGQFKSPSDCFSIQNLSSLKNIQLKAWSAKRPLDGNESYFSIFHHMHIIFDTPHQLPFVGLSDNIGFHSVSGDPVDHGELFKEDVESKSYDKTLVSRTPLEDQLLIKSINEHQNVKGYHLADFNCQTWVNNVMKTYNIKMGTATPNRGRPLGLPAAVE